MEVSTMYSVSCASLSDTNSHEENLTRLIYNAINIVTFSQLLPSSKYSCCVTELGSVYGSSTKVCKEAKTFPKVVCSTPATTISLFMVLVVVLLCTLVLVAVIVKQGKNGRRIVAW